MAFERFINTDTVTDVYRMEPWEPAWTHNSVYDSRKLQKLDLGVLREDYEIAI